jgi:hypothetical protein
LLASFPSREVNIGGDCGSVSIACSLYGQSEDDFESNGIDSLSPNICDNGNCDDGDSGGRGGGIGGGGACLGGEKQVIVSNNESVSLLEAEKSIPVSMLELLASSSSIKLEVSKRHSVVLTLQSGLEEQEPSSLLCSCSNAGLFE